MILSDMKVIFKIFVTFNDRAEKMRWCLLYTTNYFMSFVLNRKNPYFHKQSRSSRMNELLMHIQKNKHAFMTNYCFETYHHLKLIIPFVLYFVVKLGSINVGTNMTYFLVLLYLQTYKMFMFYKI